jgi:hypothetical protein
MMSTLSRQGVAKPARLVLLALALKSSQPLSKR